MALLGTKHMDFRRDIIVAQEYQLRKYGMQILLFKSQHFDVPVLWLYQ